jgi:sugar transferase (PEP-CTERM/EpsH1 system associated)
MAAGLTGGSLTHALLDSASLKSACRELVATRRPDVVLALCSGMARFALEPPLRDMPLVLDMIDVDSEKWRSLSQTAPAPRRWIYGMEARRLARFEALASTAAQSVLVVNERERTVLRQIAPDATVHALPNGVECDELRPSGPPTDDPVVVFCGVMNYEPNEQGVLWFAREVWPAIRSQVPLARFCIVGSGPTAAIRRLADDPQITVTGSVPDVRPYLWRSAVAVAPLLIARGIQNKVLEAVASGLPCVVTPAVSGGLPDEMRPACIEAVDATAFSVAVVSLLNRTGAERRELAGRANVGVLNWEARLAPLLPILTSAMRRERNL